MEWRGNMDLSQLRYFLAVAESQSITKAANKYMIPQPAMSKTISNLEKELEVQLFNRYGNRIELNESGKRFYDSVFNTLKELDNGINSLKLDNGKMVGEINFLVLQNRNAVIDIVAGFMKSYPNIKFNIYHSCDLPKGVNFDFCLANENTHIPNADTTLLFEEEIMLAVNKLHPFSSRQTVSLDDIKNERFISMPNSSELGKIVKSECKKHSITLNNTIICDDPFYVRKYVALDMGVAFAPSIAWRGLWSENVKLISIKDEKIRRRTYLFSAKNTKTKIDARQIFKDYLIEKIGSLK